MRAKLDGVHLIDASFRHNLDPFGGEEPEPTPKNGGVEMDVEALGTLEPNHYIVKLRVRVESPDATPKARYSAAVTHAVLLRVEAEADEKRPDNLVDQLMILGATIAFPYAREVVSNLTSRGKFGPIWLNPHNFVNLFGKAKELTVRTATGPDE